MSKKEKLISIVAKTNNLLENSDDFYVYVNITNYSIHITDRISEGRVSEEFLENNNDVYYGSFSFSKAVAFAKILSDLYHIEYRETFNIRTTNGSNNEIKAF